MRFLNWNNFRSEGFDIEKNGFLKILNRFF